MTSVIIRLQNLPISANASNIRRFFSGLSIPEGGVHIVGGEKGDAFIAFATDEDARQAMLLDQQTINNTKIKLFLSSKTEMQSVIEMARSSVVRANQQLSHLQKPQSHQQPVSDKSFYTSALSKGAYSGSTSTSTEVSSHGYGAGTYWSNDRNGNNDFASYNSEKRPPPSRRDDLPSENVSSRYANSSTSYPPEVGYYGDENGFGYSKPKESPLQPTGFSNDKFSDAGRDFSVRPPWLSDGSHNHYPKRICPPETVQNDQFPVKRNRTDDAYPNNRELPCLDYVVKISMRPADVSIKGIFDLLRGVNIVPKFGVRAEEDANKRYTGNVYCLLTCPESHARALSYHKKLINGFPIEIYSSSAEEFFKVTDTSFAIRCPPFLQNRIPPKGSYKPLYYSDACVEMSEIPANVTEEDIVGFLGVPGLSISDVKISQSGVPQSVVALVHLPSIDVLNILLDAPSRPFSESQSRDLKLVAISALQFKYAPPRQPLHGSKTQSDNGSLKFSMTPKSETKTCCFIYGFQHSVTIFDITQIFPNVFIPGDAIHLLPNGRSAVIDFVSEEGCRNALRDFQVAEDNLKKIHRLLSMRAITKAEYNQKIEESQEEPSKQITPEAGATEVGSHAPRFRPPFSSSRPSFSPRGMGSRPPYPSHPRPRFNRPPGGSFPVANVIIKNLPQSCPSGALMDLFSRFHPLPGSLRFRRDPRGSTTSEALISFGNFADAERAVRETNSTRLFNRTISVYVQPS